MADQTSAPVTITLVLGAEVPFTDTTDMLVRVTNDRDVTTSFWAKTPTVQTTVQFHNGPGDDYRIVVHVKGYEQAGAFVHADPKVHPTLTMLMIPQPAKLAFPAWADLKAKVPATAKLIAGGVDEATAQSRYEALGKQQPLSLASLMNLSAAMAELELGGGKTPIDFIREVIWDDTLAQDRFFGYADPAIIPLIRAATADGEFEEEKNCATFHKGSTCSYKQSTFDYSNVQLTFHEEDKKLIGDVQCIKIEPDMDLYKNLLSHGVAEVVPNLSTGGLTNPLDVLALRWIDAVQSDEPLFNPGYVLS